MSISKIQNIRCKKMDPIVIVEHIGYTDNTSQKSVYLKMPTAEIITHDAYDVYIDLDPTGTGYSSPNRKKLTYLCTDESSCVSSDLSPIDHFLPVNQNKAIDSSLAIFFNESIIRGSYDMSY